MRTLDPSEDAPFVAAAAVAESEWDVDSEPRQLSSRTLRLAMHAGTACIVLWFAGLALAGFIPQAPSAAASAHQIAHYFAGRTALIRVGMGLADVGILLLIPWGVAVAMVMRTSEPRFPILTYTQISAVIAAAIWQCGCTLFWSVAAFRAPGGDGSADTIRLMYDVGWFSYVFTWTTTALWAVSFGLSVLWDKRPDPPFPGWAGRAALIGAALMVPGCLLGIMPKHGAFNFTGVITFWIPISAFLLLRMVVIAPVLSKVIRQERLLEEREGVATTMDADV